MSTRSKRGGSPNGVRAGTTGTGSPLAESGVVAGYVLRLLRIQAGATREQLAQRLAVDPETVKSWETGRRALGNVRVHTLRTLRRELLRAGADEGAIRVLDTAMDADLFLSDVVTGANPPDRWLLATTVATRELVDLVLWPITGQPPVALQGMDGARKIPRFGAGQRTQFFDALREGAENPAAGVLLRRQVFFISGRDGRSETKDWLHRVEQAALRQSQTAPWPSGWAAHRSLAVARACQGDPDLLRRFVAKDIDGDDRAETANLAYWCYWIASGGTAASDAFMAEATPGQIHVRTLLRHLTEQLHTQNPYLDLSVHSVQTLVQRHPHALIGNQAVAVKLAGSVSALLDSGIEYPPTRRALDRIAYVTRLAQEENTWNINVPS